ncbi:universal stress protein [Planctomicrobium sp. SH527]|uniref:universal stress protein n=1 Tax=Planctomicrobium sp. SH527 TaxID=3448123 RepID=UPI003F5B0A51
MASLQYNVIVVPVDFSMASENALHVAKDLAGGDLSKLRLLHVMTPLEAISPAAAWGEFSEANRQIEVKKYADNFLRKLGIEGARFDLRYGSTGLEVTDYAKEESSDLIVISSHGYHGIKRILLGSVAETILRHAHCAVLVLRRQDAE